MTPLRRLALVMSLAVAALCSMPPPRPTLGSVSASMAVRSTAPVACGPCDGWWEIGHRAMMCVDAAALFESKLTCMRTGCMAASCATWLAAFDACDATKAMNPSCFPPNDDDCNKCLTTPNALGGCLEEANACGANRSGAITCAAWLAGGDPQWLSGAAVVPVIYVEDCGCGPCASACASSCDAWGALDTKTLSGACGACLAASCSTQLATCQDGTPSL